MKTNEISQETLDVLASILPKLEAGTHEINADGKVVEK